MNKPSLFSRSYLARGVAELFVIILGVLIALAVDQWQADREDARIENAYLHALDEDLAEAILSLDAMIEKVESWRQAASRLSKIPIEGPFPDNDELITLIGIGMFELDGYENRLTVLEDMKNTGRLGLITNPDIRQSLAEIEHQFEVIRNIEGDLFNTHHGIIDPYLVDHTDLAPVSIVGYGTTNYSSLTDSGFQSAYELVGPAFGVDHGELLNDPRFRSVVAFRIVLLSSQLQRYVEMKALFLELQQQIRQNQAARN